MDPILDNTSCLFLRNDFPKISISPLSGVIKDNMHLSEVLLPAPFGPKKPNTSFLKTVKETSSRALNPLNDLFKFLTDTIVSDIEKRTTKLLKSFSK